MLYFYIAPEKELKSIFSHGINADSNGEITLMTFKREFVMKKFLFDIYVHQVLKLDVYCLFQVMDDGISGPINTSLHQGLFGDVIKKLKQDNISTRYIQPFETDTDYKGMGLEAGVFPVENIDKFSPEFKEKIHQYLKALG